jgi:hypothetical protein
MAGPLKHKHARGLSARRQGIVRELSWGCHGVSGSGLIGFILLLVLVLVLLLLLVLVLVFILVLVFVLVLSFFSDKKK